VRLALLTPRPLLVRPEQRWGGRAPPPFNHAGKVGKASSAVETLNGVDERGVESQERRASRALHVPRKLL